MNKILRIITSLVLAIMLVLVGLSFVVGLVYVFVNYTFWVVAAILFLFLAVPTAAWIYYEVLPNSSYDNNF